MITVWKYQMDLRLHLDGTFKFEAPYEAQFLGVGPEPSDPTNPNLICFWMLVDDEEDRRGMHHFVVVGTGHPINLEKHMKVAGSYRGTIVIKPFARHVFCQ